ncbi:MAG TPA: hypothetical protein VHR41_11825 [Gemmatimonadales bacterium]|jgi:hypothetical protein|nr:hypothetical protein [Gemmatimonadales bacterium]
MRLVLACCGAAVLIGCTKSDKQPAADTTAAAAPAAEATPAPPRALSLSDLAGKWTVRTMAETGDSTLLTYELLATADSSGWKLTFPKRKPIPVRVVAVEGDSLVTEAGPFESALRKGVQVRTRMVSRLEDGKLVSKTVARYATSGPDSVRNLRSEGTRAP